MHPFLIDDDEFLNRIGYDPTKYRMSMEMNINVSQNVMRHQESELMKAIRFNIKRHEAEHKANVMTQPSQELPIEYLDQVETDYLKPKPQANCFDQ